MSADRWFRRLLRMLPFDMRVDYGDEMARVFREERCDAAASGRMGTVRVWLRAIAGVFAVAPREHLAQLAQDVRYALRTMRRRPGFVGVAVMTLALGIGANTAIFSVAHAVLLRPLPYGEPDRLVAVWNRWDGTDAAALSNPEFLDYAEQSRTLALAASTGSAVNVAGDGREPERVAAAAITANALHVLGVAPVLGRPFRQEESERGAAAVAILSHGFWQRRFGGDPSTVGRSIVVNGQPCEVVGVMPPDVQLPHEVRAAARAELYVPLGLDPAAPRHRRGGHYLQSFARLATGASVEAASTEMAGIIARLSRQYPDEHDQGNFAVVVRPLRDDLLGDARSVLAILSVAVALVLLLACANVANLLLARGESRRRELAVRTALGASRFRVVRQLLTESTLLAAGGAAAGLVLASWLQRIALASSAGSLPRLDGLTVDWSVVGFAALLSLGTAVLFGLLPALHLSRDRAHDCLKEGGRGRDAGRTWVRRGLVIAQVGIALVLMSAAGLLVKSYARLVSVPSGVDPENVLTMRVTLPAARYPQRPEITAFFDRLLERVAALPGVVSAGAGTGLPMAFASGDWSFDIEGRPRIGTRYPGAADWYVVTPGYFEALRIPLERGRLPAASDDSRGAPVVFVNQAAVRAIFPGEDPIGRRIRLSSTTGSDQPWRTIAGIVADVRYRGLDAPPRPELFIPHDQFVHFSTGGQARARSLVIRTSGNPMDLAGAVRAELGAVDPEIPAAGVRDMATILRESVSDRRLHAFVIAASGGLALALAAIGLYGVMAYTVAQRTSEMGLRIAMGASRGSVLSLVVREGLWLVLAGAAAGLVAALPMAGSLTDMLFDVQPRDFGIYAGAVAVLLAVGALASAIPARRATRVDPLTALRSE